MPLPQERVWTHLYKDEMSDKMRTKFQQRVADMFNAHGTRCNPSCQGELDDLRREVSDLRKIITELVLRIDLQNLGIDSKEIFLPGLKIGDRR